ncbi:MAG TPA: hypothetical protein VND64_01385 [Pirellulales bacterium]|nr:hypothetical protein [Pirellulales bacterium]
MPRHRLQFRLSTLFWLTSLVGAFFFSATFVAGVPGDLVIVCLFAFTFACFFIATKVRDDD